MRDLGVGVRAGIAGVGDQVRDGKIAYFQRHSVLAPPPLSCDSESKAPQRFTARIVLNFATPGPPCRPLGAQHHRRFGSKGQPFASAPRMVKCPPFCRAPDVRSLTWASWLAQSQRRLSNRSAAGAVTEQSVGTARRRGQRAHDPTLFVCGVEDIAHDRHRLQHGKWGAPWRG